MIVPISHNTLFDKYTIIVEGKSETTGLNYESTLSSYRNFAQAQFTLCSDERSLARSLAMPITQLWKNGITWKWLFSPTS